MAQNKKTFKATRKILLTALLLIAIITVVFIINMGEKNLRFLKSDNIASVKMEDSVSQQTVEFTRKSDIEKVVGALRNVTTYANVRSKDAKGSKLTFSIVYEDDRTRKVVLADPLRTDFAEKSGLSQDFENAVVQVNNRWYKTNSRTVTLLYRIYQDMH